MAQAASTQTSSRALALARRKALSTQGKRADTSTDRTRGETTGATASSAPVTPAPAAGPAIASSGQPASNQPTGSARSLARARRDALAQQGKRADTSTDRTRAQGAAPVEQSAPTATPTPAPAEVATQQPEAAPTASPARRIVARGNGGKPAGRSLALARRHAMSSRGKVGADAAKAGNTAAAVARQTNPNLSSRDLARAVREQRSSRGRDKTEKSAPCGRVRPQPPAAAEDASWKVGASETTQGQTVTGTLVGRSPRVTGDEPSTCRNVTGTEYLGADLYRQFCETDPVASPRKVGMAPTQGGLGVTGTLVGRAPRVTGDEPGTCKRVTGTEYATPGQFKEYCGTEPERGPRKFTMSETRKGMSVSGNNIGRSTQVTGDEAGAERELTGTVVSQAGDAGRAPKKVGVGSTLRGGAVTGNQVGRSSKVTGDEPGACKNVTGDEYIGADTYQAACGTTPAPEAPKVGLSTTFKEKTVTGTQTGRSGRVTGDEPGTCKAVTGTPYAGSEQYAEYCPPPAQQMAAARTRPLRQTPGPDMTGLQPGLTGKRFTGAERGACEPLTGTPYVGTTQYQEACAAPGNPDFPQPLEGAPWQTFSVLSPARAAQAERARGAVTGTRYEQGHITGAFDMGAGKITGTEEFRFGDLGGQRPAPIAAPMPASSAEPAPADEPRARITGEGMDAGPKITGDDWDRNERVTGTEGLSSTRRNPTRRGSGQTLLPPHPIKRNDPEDAAPNLVTGSVGSSERGATITVSGGARG
jgi:hypothetical protein